MSSIAVRESSRMPGLRKSWCASACRRSDEPTYGRQTTAWTRRFSETHRWASAVSNSITSIILDAIETIGDPPARDCPDRPSLSPVLEENSPFRDHTKFGRLAAPPGFPVGGLAEGVRHVLASWIREIRP